MLEPSYRESSIEGAGIARCSMHGYTETGKPNEVNRISLIFEAGLGIALQHGVSAAAGCGYQQSRRFGARAREGEEHRAGDDVTDPEV